MIKENWNWGYQVVALEAAAALAEERSLFRSPGSAFGAVLESQFLRLFAGGNDI